MEKVQLSCYLPREVKRQLKAELARREINFSSWVELMARRELAADAEPAAELVES